MNRVWKLFVQDSEKVLRRAELKNGKKDYYLQAKRKAYQEARTPSLTTVAETANSQPEETVKPGPKVKGKKEVKAPAVSEVVPAEMVEQDTDAVEATPS